VRINRTEREERNAQKEEKQIQIENFKQRGKKRKCITSRRSHLLSSCTEWSPRVQPRSGRLRIDSFRISVCVLMHWEERERGWDVCEHISNTRKIQNLPHSACRFPFANSRLPANWLRIFCPTVNLSWAFLAARRTRTLPRPFVLVCQRVAFQRKREANVRRIEEIFWPFELRGSFWRFRVSSFLGKLLT